MRSIRPYLPILFFVLTPAMGQEKSDVQREGLAGPVQQVYQGKWSAEGTPEHYKLSGRLPSEHTAFSFTRNGLMSTKVLFDTANAVIDSCSFLYDEKGDLLRMTAYSRAGLYRQIEYSYDADRQVISKSGSEYDESFAYTYKYVKDNNGRKIKTECFKANQADVYITYGYNKGGRLIEQTEYFPGGSIKNQTLYTWDTAGNMTKKIILDPFSGLASAEYKIPFFYAHDDKGRKTEERGFNNSGNYAYLFRFDEKGNRTVSYDLFFAAMDENGEEMPLTQSEIDNAVQEISEQYHTSQIVYKYDSLGRETETVCTNNGYRTNKQYDTYGNLTQHNELSWQYVYDAHGNWTRKFQFREKKLESVCIRTINYFR